MPSKKHYIITAITLGCIAAGSAALIGVTNLVTRDRIAKNEQNKITNGLVSIFGKGTSIIEEADLDKFNYVNHYYKVDEGKMAFKTTGSNMYGEVSLIIGFNYTDFIKMVVVTNEQTYATTLDDEYIDHINDGSRDVDDVSCGATFGAKLVRDMVNEASEVAKEMNGKE